MKTKNYFFKLNAHLLELKHRLFLIIFFILNFGFFICLKKETLIFFVLCLSNQTSFICIKIDEFFSVFFYLLEFFTKIFFLFYFLKELIAFIFNGLYLKEKLFLKKNYTFFVLVLFIYFLFFNYFVFPRFWNYLSIIYSFQEELLFFEPMLEDCVNFYIFCLHWGGILFVLFFGILSFLRKKLEKIKQYRKIFFLIFLIFATLVSPPSVTYQLLFWVGFIQIFELNLFFLFYFKTLTRQPV